MKLETIKRNNKKKIIIGSMIVLSVVGCITLTTTRAKYRSVQSLKLASGTVKINSYDFKIMAMYQSEDGENYTDINTMPESGYIINEEKSYCTTDNKTKVKGKLKTIDGNHVIIGLNKSDKCYIWFDKSTAAGMLISSFESYKGYKKDESPDFTQIATGAETEDNNGIYKVADGMYGNYSYYWRGAATTNHVIFDNKCWRIIRINGDKSIRLIYNGAVQGENTCHGNGIWDGGLALENKVYNSRNDNSSYVGWTYTIGSQRPSDSNPQTSGDSSPLKTELENWYSGNISESSKTKIETGKFCNDRNVSTTPSSWGSGYVTTWSATGTQFAYAGIKRLYEDYSPTLSCSNGDVYELNVGMITADEVQFAGTSTTLRNTSYYLYIGRHYWTMTPYYWWNNFAFMFRAGSDGLLEGNGNVVTTNGVGVRPVINLRSDVTFNAGSDGTQNNPYIVQ